MTTINEAKIKVNEKWVSLVPDATTSSKGIVQVGSGLSVTDGVLITLPQEATYPLKVSTSMSTTGTDYNQHTLITNNTSNLSSLFGITFDTTTTTETKSVTWTTHGGGSSVAVASGHIYTYAKNIFTNATTQLTDDYIYASSGTTNTHTAVINKFEILTYSVVQTSGNTFYGGISSVSAPNVYLVTPSE